MSVSTNTIPLSNQSASSRNLPQATMIGAVLAIIANLLILNMGRAFGIPFELVPPGGTEIIPLPVWPVLIAASIVPAIGAAILLALLPLWTKRPYLAFWIISAIVLYLSMSGPESAVTDSQQTIDGLKVMHYTTAAVIVSALTALGREEG